MKKNVPISDTGWRRSEWRRARSAGTDHDQDDENDRLAMVSAALTDPG
jgi:hypothetical protein